MLQSDLPKHLKALKAFTGLMDLRISSAEVNGHIGLDPADARAKCKSIISGIASRISVKKSCTVDRAQEDLFSYLVEAHTKIDKGTMDGLSGKLFS